MTADITNPEKTDLYIAAIEHRYSVDFSIHATREAAERHVDAFTEEWWETELDEPLPADGVDRDYYFERAADESYVIDKVPTLTATIAEALAPLAQ